MRERLKEKLSDKVIESLFTPTIDNELKRSFNNMMKVNKAHLSMLVTEGIISKKTGEKINGALIDIENIRKENFEINYELEDLYFNIEEKIIQKLGVEIGGQLHTGRSRNDLNATVTRMNTRDYLLDICELLIELRRDLYDLAKKNKELLITGYTHMQPAEPITLGHYFSAILFALERDFSRLINSLKNTNISPLGSGAMASTSYKINRAYTSNLLGFDGYMNNSLDGIASRDYMIETISSMNILMNSLSRVSYDLYIWSTYEYGLVEVSDSVAVTSSIMPQKKNPITLEHIKGKSSHVMGAVVSITSSIKNTSYGHSRDLAGESQTLFWEGMKETKSSLELFNETIKGIQFDEKKMISQAKKNLSSVTELANTLVRKSHISFREAHGIVGSVVTYLLENNLGIENINSDLINNISLRTIQKRIELSEHDIENSLDPLLNVKSKNVEGGPAPEEVSNKLLIIKQNIESDNVWYSQFKEQISQKVQYLSELKI